MSSARIACLVVYALAFAGRAAQSQEHVGQAMHPEKLGTVHFQTSCRPAVTGEFDHAVALLHSFEFGPSIRGFQAVLATDSTCAMAYWGIALSRWINPFIVSARSAEQLRQGLDAVTRGERLASFATDRERGYITAVGKLYAKYDSIPQRGRIVAYERAMSDVAARYPQDTEATIFHALALVAAAPPTDKTYANQIAAGSVLERLFAAEPNHPGLAHYIIHSYDVPALASRAVPEANRYASIAPSAPHALHMPSHIFTRVGLWDQSIKTNLRAIDEARSQGTLYEMLHASDYAVYAYLQLAQDRAARRIMDGLAAVTAKYGGNVVASAAPAQAGIFALAAIPARYAVERHAWAEAAALDAKPSAFPWSEALTYFSRALGAAHTGELAKARDAVDSLGAIRARLSAANESYWAEQVAIEQLGARAWLSLAEHRDGDALGEMREAAAREDATEKNAVTPGPLAPARELLGDMLLQLRRPAEALTEYRATLEKEPNRLRALYGAMRAASLSGDRRAAKKYADQLRALTANADKPGRPELRRLSSPLRKR